MGTSRTTCWTTIHDASAGEPEARAEFARRYAPVIRAYLVARWRDQDAASMVEDALQEVFLECLRPNGVLDRVAADPPKEFRAFLYGVLRNVARRHEQRRARGTPALSDEELRSVEARERSLSEVLDRAWAEAIVRDAAAMLAQRAEGANPRAVRRVELLRLRFSEGKPIREIAREWRVDAADVHAEYRVARREFRTALEDVIGFHYPDSPEAARQALNEVLTTLDGQAAR